MKKVLYTGYIHCIYELLDRTCRDTFNRSVVFRVHAYQHTYICSYIRLYIHTYIYIYTYVHTYVNTYTFVHIQVQHTYIHMFIYWYIRSYIHTYIYTYIRSYVRVHVLQRKGKKIRNKNTLRYFYLKILLQPSDIYFKYILKRAVLNINILTCCPYPIVLVTSRLVRFYVFVNCIQDLNVFLLIVQKQIP